MNNVLNLRKQKGMTQDEFAEFCDVSRASIARYEAGGNVNRENAEKMAKACLVTVDWVIGRVPEESAVVGNKKESPPELDGDVQEMLIQFQRLPLPDRQRVLGFVEGLLSSRGQ